MCFCYNCYSFCEESFLGPKKWRKPAIMKQFVEVSLLVLTAASVLLLASADEQQRTGGGRSAVQSSIEVAAACRIGSAQQSAGDRPTYRADDFVERVSIEYTPGDKNGPSKFGEYFRDLGICYYRTSLWWAFTCTNQPEICERIWRETGARPLLLVVLG